MNRPFSGWQAGLPFYGPALAIGAAVLALSGLAGAVALWAGALLLLLGLGMLLFFRDFPRTVTAAANEVVAPADGTVSHVEDLEDSPHYEGPTRRISIFLSVLDVHVNRAPFECIVAEIRYAAGQFKDARSPDCAQVNESNTLRLDTARGPMTVRQISGAIARRIVCPVGVGETLSKGEKFGMIRFGSRTDLFLPPGTEVCVRVGQKVRAGLSVVARFEEL